MTKHGQNQILAALDELERQAAKTAKAVDDLVEQRNELLEAAQKALKVSEDWIHDQYDGTSMFDGAWAELDSVRAAIAKAKGL